MSMKMKYVLVLALSSALALGSCATTKLSIAWKDPAYTGDRLKKIMVIGIADRQEMRRIFENNFVASLMYSGVDAVSSLQLMPGEEKLTKETIQAALKGSNIDAVIVTRLVGINVKYTKSPGGYYAVPYAYYNDFYSYYNQVYTYAIVEAAPVYEAKETVSLETNLYGVENAKLIWAVVSKTLKKDSVIDSIDSLTSKLIGKLIEDGLV